MLGNPEPPPTEENKPPKPLLGDRVIWTKNDYELNLFNGTQAIVVDFPKGGTLLFTEDGREVVVPGDKNVHVEVAYAMTIHKSQGSEWPFVLLVAGSAHWNMHDRNLLYTGASRAAESLMMICALFEKFRSRGRRTFMLNENVFVAVPSPYANVIRTVPTTLDWVVIESVRAV